MARYLTEIESALPPDEAFAYMADFSNARFWDPSVRRAERAGDGRVGGKTAFDLVTRFAGRDVELRYTIVEYDPPRRVVLEARRPGFVSTDTITVKHSFPTILRCWSRCDQMSVVAAARVRRRRRLAYKNTSQAACFAIASRGTPVGS